MPTGLELPTISLLFFVYCCAFVTIDIFIMCVVEPLTSSYLYYKNLDDIPLVPLLLVWYIFLINCYG